MIEPTPRPTYEAMRGYLRNWNNPNDEIGQYDANGLVHLVLAALDNLRENEDWADLPELRDSMTDEQAAFFLRLAGYVRGSLEANETVLWPTVAQVLDYLRAMGFVVGPGKPGYTVANHPTDECWFVFIDREPDSPARETELLNVRGQLTHRGFVTDDEFARFWNPRARRAETPAPVGPQ